MYITFFLIRTVFYYFSPPMNYLAGSETLSEIIYGLDIILITLGAVLVALSKFDEVYPKSLDIKNLKKIVLYALPPLIAATLLAVIGITSAKAHTLFFIQILLHAFFFSATIATLITLGFDLGDTLKTKLESRILMVSGPLLTIFNIPERFYGTNQSIIRDVVHLLIYVAISQFIASRSKAAKRTA